MAFEVAAKYLYLHFSRSEDAAAGRWIEECRTVYSINPFLLIECERVLHCSGFHCFRF